MKSFTDEHLCRLFEKFVLEYYRAKHPEYKAQAAQIDWNIDREVEEAMKNLLLKGFISLYI